MGARAMTGHNRPNNRPKVGQQAINGRLSRDDDWEEHKITDLRKAAMTTLNKIRRRRPCADVWAKLLSHLGKTKTDNEPLALRVILDSNGLDDALWCLRACDGIDRDARLYAVWCARQVQHLMTDPRSIAALNVATRHANGEATDAELAAARTAARTAEWGAAARAAANAARDAAWDAAWDAADAAWTAAAAADAAWAAVRAAQTKKFVEMFCEGQQRYGV